MSNPISFAQLAAQAAQAKATATAVVPPLNAGTYLCSGLRLSSLLLVTGDKSKSPGKRYMRVMASVTVDDPNLAENNLPSREVSCDVLTTFLTAGTRAFTPTQMELPDGSKLNTGLSLEGNNLLWSVVSKVFVHTGLAVDEGGNGAAFSFPEDGQVLNALYADANYIQNGEALVNGENPVNHKGEPITDEQFHQFVLPDNQITALNALLKAQIEQYKLKFKVELVLKAPREGSKTGMEENEIATLWLVANDEEIVLI